MMSGHRSGRFFVVAAIAASTAWAQQSGRTGPFVEVRDARPVNTRYHGDTLAVQALAGGSARALSLASADFDEDGMPDLASGHATIAGTGVIGVHRGNVDALWPYGAALHDGPPPAFLPDARVVAIPEAPDFLGAGDFDADGHADIVTARLGSHALYLLRGDGHGGFSPAEKIALPGAVTAFTTGEINRLDGLTDIAVGIVGDSGWQVLVFESPNGALRAKPEILSIPAAATSLALGALDDSGMNSLAVAAGNDLLIFHGRDRRLSYTRTVRESVPAAAVTRQSFPYALRALATGRFTSNLLDLAVLGDDGKVRFFERPDADYQASVMAAHLAVASPHGGPSHGRPSQNWAGSRPAKPAGKDLILSSEVALPFTGQIATRLTAAHTSIGPGEDLLALDGLSGQIHFLSRWSGGAAGEERTMHLAASMAAPGGATALLPMRLQPSAFHALVLLNSGRPEPMVAPVNSPTVFTVTTTADSGPAESNLYSTRTPGSLRTAITNANDTTGPTSIVFNIPVSDANYNLNTGVFTIQPLPNTNCNSSNGSSFVPCQALPPLPAGCTMDGYTQPGGSLNGITQPPASPNTLANGDNAVLKIEINGALDGQGPDGVDVSGTTTVRGLILTGFNTVQYPDGTTEGGDGIDLSSASNYVEGNFSGVDYRGATAKPNNTGIADFGSSNTIGGTTPQARNLVAANQFANFTSPSISTPGTELFQGNYSGTDRTGKIALGGAIAIAGQSITIGGTSAGAGNLISGGGGVGIAYASPSQFTPANNVVQGNFIGVDVTGAKALPNVIGLSISSGDMNLIGGTTPAARNIISGNNGDGIEVFNGSDQNLIQGNYIGVDVSGTVNLGNTGDGINHTGLDGTANAVQTLIGGEAAGAGNAISANSLNGIELGGAANDVFGQTGSTVLGNRIGTDPTGATAMGNQGAGVLIDQGGSFLVIGNTDTPSTNTIAYNSGDGVTIDPATGNIYIGVQTGNNSVTNNLIYSNGGSGLRIISGVHNQASDNSIYSNSQLGIDVDAPGPLVNSNCNSVTSGANNLQNAPVLTPASPATTYISATATDPAGDTSEFSNCAAMGFQGNNLDIAGSLNSYPSTTFRVEFFENPACDPAGYGQGKTFLTAISVTTNASCIATFGILTDLNNADLTVNVGYNSALTTVYTAPGASFTYLTTVTNNGSASAANVVLSDPFPSSLTVNSVSITQGSCGTSNNTVTCNIGTMPSGTTATATITATVNTIGNLPTTATVSSSTTGPNPANNSSTLTLISAYSNCDINQNGVTNVLDAQGTVNQGLGVIAAANDLNGNHWVNVVDVQVVINAILNLGCSVQ
jgi:uncharacterized repeat protein (TIGR01451 family)